MKKLKGKYWLSKLNFSSNSQTNFKVEQVETHNPYNIKEPVISFTPQESNKITEINQKETDSFTDINAISEIVYSNPDFSGSKIIYNSKINYYSIDTFSMSIGSKIRELSKYKDPEIEKIITNIPQEETHEEIPEVKEELAEEIEENKIEKEEEEEISKLGIEIHKNITKQSLKR